MEERNDACREERFPGEIVETYRQKEYREVVERYVRPLPVRMCSRQVQPVSRPRSRRRMWIFLACFGVVILLSAGVTLWNWLRPQPDSASDPYEWDFDGYDEDLMDEEVSLPTWPAGQGAELAVTREYGEALTAQEIYRQVNPAVVTVITYLEGGRMSVGTGVMFREDGYLVTNYHVVAGGQQCLASLNNGYNYEALYVAGDPENDLAVLKVNQTGLPFAEFGDSDLLTVGDPVYAIGNPLGMELRGTLTDGIVSAINRDVEVDGRIMTLIQTNAALNTGNSGGPLINQYGQVVGINVIKMHSEYSNVEGLGFAIPSAYMDRMVNDLLAYGEIRPEPLLGLSVRLEAAQLEDNLQGLEVVEITPDKAADRAGVQVGDYVVSAGGEELLTSNDLLRVRRQYYVGDALPLMLWRDGEIVEVTLQLQESVEN